MLTPTSTMACEPLYRHGGALAPVRPDDLLAG